MTYTIQEVEHDNYGDPQWKFYVQVHDNGKLVLDDYFGAYPSLEDFNRVLNEHSL